jgi:hypothetical protein
VEKGAIGVLFSIIILSLLLSLQVNCAVWVGRAACGVAFLDNFFFFSLHHGGMPKSSKY